MTFVEAALDVHSALKALSPEQKQDRRRAQWREYGTSEKGRTRRRKANARYAVTVAGQLARTLAAVRSNAKARVG